MINLQHTYGYVAFFEDGTQIHHDFLNSEDDVSSIDPTKSKFFDVLDYNEKNSKLISFVLYNQDKTLGVDLRDGHFEWNKVPFWLHRPEHDGYYKDFRIIYLKTNCLEYFPASGEKSGFVKGYTLGWQVTHNGKNIQKTVTL